MRGTDETAVVRWPFDLEHRVVNLLPRSRERLLELRLVVDMARTRVLDARAERVHDRRLDPLEPVLEVDGRDRSLEDGGKDVSAPRDALQLVLPGIARVLEKSLSEPELLRDCGAALA